MTVNLAIIIIAIMGPLLGFGFWLCANTSRYSEAHEVSGILSTIGLIISVIAIFISLGAGVMVDLSKLVQIHAPENSSQSASVAQQYDKLAK